MCSDDQQGGERNIKKARRHTVSCQSATAASPRGVSAIFTMRMLTVEVTIRSYSGI